MQITQAAQARMTAERRTAAQTQKWAHQPHVQVGKPQPAALHAKLVLTWAGMAPPAPRCQTANGLLWLRWDFILHSSKVQ